MSDARETILARVRMASGATGAGATGARAATPVPRPVREYQRADRRPREQLVALFCERMADYRAEVERVSAERLPELIAVVAMRHGARTLVIPAELPPAWRPDGIELIADTGLTPRQLDAVDGVLSGCTAAIAQTGTIALTSAPHEGRRALSLVPDLHICIVEESQVVGTVPEAITLLGGITQASRRPVTLISGPSATSDIELQRVEGVHGPRRLVVLVVTAG
jgi:L-lactate dehydrogenase complex protein LldG